MAKLRSVSTAFWSDPFIEDLTPIEKLLFLYLITNEKTNMLGIYEASDRKISFETGIDSESISNALKRFETLGKVKRVDNWVILVNFLKHQSFNTNMKKSAIDTYNDLPKEMKIKGLDVDKSNPLEGFERLLKGFGMVRKVEVEYEVEDELEKEGEDESQKSINDIEVVDPLPIDSYFPLEVLERHYLSSDKVIKEVLKNKENKFNDREHLEKRLKEFISKTIQEGELIKTPKDFASHFRNWHKINIKSEKPKVSNPNNEKIIRFKDNVNPTVRELPESKFLAMEERDRSGGYIYTRVG